MRAWLSAVWLSAAWLLAGCSIGTSQSPQPQPPAAAPHGAGDDASAKASAAPRAEAPVLLDIPLLSGDAEPLSRSHGRVVVLLLSSTDRPGWSVLREHFETMMAEVGRARLTVIAVANDAEVTPLRLEWDRDPPPFLMGWDPDGALALRLGVAKMPATFVLDIQGRPLGSVVGSDAAALEQIDAWVQGALPPKPVAPPLAEPPPDAPSGSAAPSSEVGGTESG